MIIIYFIFGQSSTTVRYSERDSNESKVTIVTWGKVNAILLISPTKPGSLGSILEDFVPPYFIEIRAVKNNMINRVN